MIQNSIKKTVEKALNDFGQDVLIFKDHKDNYYNRSISLAKYDRQFIESDNSVSTLADRYKFTMFSEVELNNYIAYKNKFYKVLSVDDTREDIYIAYAEYSTIKVPIFSLEVNPNISLKIGNKVNVNAKAYRDTVLIENPTITYKSSNNAIATVDKVGNITAINSGRCEITVMFNEVVTVVNVDIAEIVYTLDLNTYSLELTEEDTFKIDYVCKVDGIVDEIPTLLYSSTNNTVATVDEAGNITTIKEGSCIIKVTYYNVEKQINLVVNKVVAPSYSIKAYTGVFEINRWDTNKFTVYNGSIEDKETWNITIDYKGNTNDIATITSKTNNSVIVTNTGVIGKEIDIVFTKGEIILRQIVKLVK